MSLVAAGWALWYAMYRGYYGLGGTVGMFGTPTSETDWRAINLAGAAVLLMVALLPVATLPLWKRPRLRPALLALCWVLAVGFTMHGLIDDVRRVLSLTGTLHIDYPLFTTVDRHAADIQDLAFNETWFLAEGILWACSGGQASDGRRAAPVCRTAGSPNLDRLPRATARRPPRPAPDHRLGAVHRPSFALQLADRSGL